MLNQPPNTHRAHPPSAARRMPRVLLPIMVFGMVALIGSAGYRLNATTVSSIAGSYQCWKFNVGLSTITQVGQSILKCTSPDLVLNADGSYTLGSEKGSFTVTGGKVALSQSKYRGLGTLLEHDLQISFSYNYNGKHYEVTYLKRDGGPAEPAAAAPKIPSVGTLISVDLTLLFPSEDKSVGWINTVTLLHLNGDFGAEALAVTDGKQKVTAYFRAVRSGSIYTINVGSGFDRREVAKLDLTGTSGRVVRTIRVQAAEGNAESTLGETKPPAPRATEKTTKKPNGRTRQKPRIPTPIRTDAPAPIIPGTPCNPLIPRYAQPGCTGE